jgi:hypothetical protein
VLFRSSFAFQDLPKTRWTLGDFNADGAIDGSDFNQWNANRFAGAMGALESRRPPRAALAQTGPPTIIAPSAVDRHFARHSGSETPLSANRQIDVTRSDRTDWSVAFNSAWWRKLSQTRGGSRLSPSDSIQVDTTDWLSLVDGLLSVTHDDARPKTTAW